MQAAEEYSPDDRGSKEKRTKKSSPRKRSRSATTIRLLAQQEHSLFSLFELSHELTVSLDTYEIADLALFNLMGHFGCSKAGMWIAPDSEDRELVGHLQRFGRSSDAFNLVLFPEGTRGDGQHVACCQPGVFTIAQAAETPIVQVFISGMERVS